MECINRITKIKGCITVPGDKSISHRAVMLAGISKGKSVITGFLRGEDCLSTIACCRKLGVDIWEDQGSVIVQGRGLYGLTEPEDVLNAGNSGSTMRMMSGILAGQDFVSVVSGDASLRSRPMARIVKPLREMGAAIDGRKNAGLAPLVIRGGSLKGISYSMPVSSAQVKSAVLLAGLYAQGETSVIEDTVSRDHTERMLAYFGANVDVRGTKATVKPSELYGVEVEVPGDISSAAFFLAAAAVIPGSELTIKNVGINPTRTGIIDILLNMGADLTLDHIRTAGGEAVADISVRGRKLHGTEISGEMIPRLIDEIPVIAAIAAAAEGKTTITGAAELKVKESNRIAAMVAELKKLGVAIAELEDGMEIIGPNRIAGGVVESYDDHRIAMAMAVCGLMAEGTVEINRTECVAISFPGFFELLAGVSV